MSSIRLKRAHWIVAMAMLALPGAMLTRDHVQKLWREKK